MVFTDGRVSSLQGVFDVLDNFSRMSGLFINVSKSSLYCAGTNATGLRNAAAARGLEIGTLPIRYLGLPLTTKTMRKKDYEPLVDRVRRKLLSWTTGHLSFAGRLQLLKSVINGISNFWLSVFRLPLGCLDTIESMCASFLWSGSPNVHNKTKVSWADVTKPKREGGLGIRRLRDVSRVFALSLIWRLITSAGSLWVSWIQRHLLRGSSFWEPQHSNRGSWVWSRLTQLRDLAASFLRYEIRDGKTARFWFDDWLPIGRLFPIAGTLGIQSSGVPLSALVSEAADRSRWTLRNRLAPTMQAAADLLRHTPVPCASSGADIPLWKHGEGVYKAGFSASQTWEQIRTRYALVPWSSIIWFPQAIPRCSFVAWLAVRDRLATGTRMRSWGSDQACVFCGEKDESRDHLFFACPYTFTVWIELCGDLLTSHATPDWQDTVAFLTTGNTPPMDRVLLRLAFQLSIYHLWRERNSRIHGGPSLPRSIMLRIIDRIMRNRISSLRYQFPHRFEGLLRRWFDTRPTSPVVP